MPYEVQSHCRACTHTDTFVIGNWPEHLGVYVCASCGGLVNVPVATGQCPGCGQAPARGDYYDYSLAIPYLGGQVLRTPEPGPPCPQCQRAPHLFENQAHRNMSVVLNGAQQARAAWGRDYMEKAIFMNSMAPVIKEFRLNQANLFEYFNLEMPTAPLISDTCPIPSCWISGHMS